MSWFGECNGKVSRKFSVREHYTLSNMALGVLLTEYLFNKQNKPLFMFLVSASSSLFLKAGFYFRLVGFQNRMPNL